MREFTLYNYKIPLKKEKKNQNSFLWFTVFNNVILLKHQKNDKTFTSNEDIVIHVKYEQ